MIEWQNIRKDLGAWLASQRMSRGLSQSEVAKKVDYNNSQFLSSIERGVAGPPSDLLKKLLVVYQVDKEVFYTFIEKRMAKEIRAFYGD